MDNLRNFTIIFMVTCFPYKEIHVGANWVRNAKLKFYRPSSIFDPTKCSYPGSIVVNSSFMFLDKTIKSSIGPGYITVYHIGISAVHVRYVTNVLLTCEILVCY